jgi:hypothetical protein
MDDEWKGVERWSGSHLCGIDSLLTVLLYTMGSRRECGCVNVLDRFLWEWGAEWWLENYVYVYARIASQIIAENECGLFSEYSSSDK